MDFCVGVNLRLINLSRKAHTGCQTPHFLEPELGRMYRSYRVSQSIHERLPAGPSLVQYVDSAVEV